MKKSNKIKDTDYFKFVHLGIPTLYSDFIKYGSRKGSDEGDCVKEAVFKGKLLKIMYE